MYCTCGTRRQRWNLTHACGRCGYSRFDAISLVLGRSAPGAGIKCLLNHFECGFVQALTPRIDAQGYRLGEAVQHPSRGEGPIPEEVAQCAARPQAIRAAVLDQPLDSIRPCNWNTVAQFNRNFSADTRQMEELDSVKRCEDRANRGSTLYRPTSVWLLFIKSKPQKRYEILRELLCSRQDYGESKRVPEVLSGPEASRNRSCPYL